MRLRPNGFSLVEMAVAIGLIAFALMALIGLMTVGISTSKESEADFRTVVIAEKVFQSVRFELSTKALFETPPSPWAGSPPSREYWFNDNGEVVEAADLSRYFRAQVALTSPAQIPSNVDGKMLKAITIEIAWPAAALKAATLSSAVQKNNFVRMLKNPGFSAP